MTFVEDEDVEICVKVFIVIFCVVVLMVFSVYSEESFCDVFVYMYFNFVGFREFDDYCV